MNEPSWKSLWNTVSRELSNSRGRRIGVLTVIGIATLSLLGIYVVQVVSTNDPGPVWLKYRSLPEAKPVWTNDDVDSNSVAIHDDVLVASSDDRESLSTFDLDTGEMLMSGRKKHQRTSLNGDYAITSKSPIGGPTDIYDIHTGEKKHTIKFGEYANYTTVSGLLIVVESTDDEKAIMRVFDIATGKEKWTTKLGKFWGTYDLSTAGPFTILRDENDSGQAEAFDVKTGEKRWSTSECELDFAPTADNDIYCRAKNGSSRILDQKTGESTKYPAPPNKRRYPLYKNLLLTTVESRPAVVDTTTRETVWRSDSPDGFQSFDGGVVFEDFTNELEDDTARTITGTRAIDVVTGKTLWNRQGPDAATSTFTAGDTVIEVVESDREALPTQAFDRETGKGRFQMDSGLELIAHNDDYLVFGSSEAGGKGASVISRKDPLG